MFEGGPPKPGDRTGPDSPESEEPLRPLTWSDLRSKLAAARDLRAELAQERGQGKASFQASFDAGFARRLARLAGEQADVNPEGSTNRKGGGGNSVQPDSNADEALRQPTTRGSQ